VEEAMDIATADTLARIRELNDAFRTSFRGGEVVLTASVAELPDMVKSAALQMVADFKDFNEENDPLEEHDYGSFDHCNREFFFKIDMYNLTMDAMSEDSADPAKTKRVLTLGLTMDW
jgi:hypothetical protein